MTPLLHNRVAVVIVVLFIVSMFYELIHLPTDTLFQYPSLSLASQRTGTALVIVSALYGLLLGTGFYLWRTKLIGLIATALLALQVWGLYEAVMRASDAYEFRMTDIGELIRYLNRDAVVQFTDTAGMFAMGLIIFLFCATLLMPYSQSSRFA